MDRPRGEYSLGNLFQVGEIDERSQEQMRQTRNFKKDVVSGAITNFLRYRLVDGLVEARIANDAVPHGCSCGALQYALDGVIQSPLGDFLRTVPGCFIRPAVYVYPVVFCDCN